MSGRANDIISIAAVGYSLGGTSGSFRRFFYVEREVWPKTYLASGFTIFLSNNAGNKFARLASIYRPISCPYRLLTN